VFNAGTSIYNTYIFFYYVQLAVKMLAHVTTEFDDNFGHNIHQLQQSAQSRREARVCYPS
jgi:hypothetical protein